MSSVRQILLATLTAIALLTPAAAAARPLRTHQHPTIHYFTATPYSLQGIGTSGKRPQSGTVAADPSVLPLNTRIRLYGAGRYSGNYTVEDTGGNIGGHHIDVYMPSRTEAKKFGRRRVKVIVLRYGDDKVRPIRTRKQRVRHRHPA
jgi:3D (Asp-Asp-Asp) domain-containing protein